MAIRNALVRTFGTRKSRALKKTPEATKWLKFQLILTVTLIVIGLVSPASTEDISEFGDLETPSVMNIDIDDFSAETIMWTNGSGRTLTIRDPGSSVVATLSSGQSYSPTENGRFTATLSGTVGTAWDLSVMSGGAPVDGRVSSASWQFYTPSSGSVDTSLYVLVPGGDADGNNTGVVEIRLNGFNGVAFSVQSNQYGLVGADGRSLNAQGQAVIAPSYDVFLNPPDLASYSVIIPRASDPTFNAGSGDVECALIEPGLNSGYFEFVSNVDGGYELTCDLNGDGQFVATSDVDTSRIGAASPGLNTVEWDGLDNSGNPVAAGTYECALVLTVGDVHFMTSDAEVAYPGITMYEVTEDGFGGYDKTPLPMYWNDQNVQLDARMMDNGEFSLERPPTDEGVMSADYADTPTPNVDARSWGRLSGGSVVFEGKGEGNHLDTYVRLRASEKFMVTIGITDGTNSDGDSLSDTQEECITGTDPALDDTDGDGLPDDEESTPNGGGDPAFVDSDGDGIPDGRDDDSNNNGIPDGDEGNSDSDGDGVPDYRDQVVVITTPEYTNDNTPDITGYTTPNTTALVMVDGVTWCASATVDAAGDFSCPALGGTPLADDKYSVLVVVNDTGGAISGTSQFTVDTIDPSITHDLTGAIDDTTPVVSGTSDANVDMEVYVDGDLVCITTANGAGIWSCDWPDSRIPLTAAGHTVSATATDAAGNEASASSGFTVGSVDQCSGGYDNCDALVSCTDDGGGVFTCGACPSGYSDDNSNGTQCTDIDECTTGTDSCDVLTTCSNTTGSYSCSACPSGYTDTNGNGTQCDDIDECTLGTDNCDALAGCTNTAGGFACGSCPSGYTDTNADGTQCDDIDECTLGTDNCDELVSCTNTGGSYTCGSCPSGYADTNGDSSQCDEINECTAETDNCDALVTCTNTAGSFVCGGCPSGYTDTNGDGTQCDDINECTLGTDNCDSLTTCTNTTGGFTCSGCPSGYTDTHSDGTQCDDINECNAETDNCDALTTCTNTAGGFSCSPCPAGYTDTNGDGTQCDDINECTLGTDNCDSLTTCTNTPGGFTCSACPSGYTDTHSDGTQCVDINECTAETDNCSDLTTCTNTAGGFNCSGCPSGYSDTSDDGTVCVDINECTLGTDNCDSLTTCTNTAGGFTCSACPSGYTDTHSDGTQCVDIDECASAGAESCGVTNGGTCLNIGGAYVCTECPEGYAPGADSMSCSEIDECLLNVDACDERATCENTDGSYRCACNAGTSGDGFSCTEIEVTGLPEDETPIQGPDVAVSGTGEPGTEVTVLADGAVGCTATVDASGNWHCKIQGLSDGDHTINVEGPNDTGDAVTIVVDSTVSVNITSPANGSNLSSSPSEIAGTGEAGASVIVTVDSIEICITQVDGSGNWQCEVVMSMDNGDYVANVTITDVAGNVATDSVLWTVDNTTSGNIDSVAVNADSPTTELDGTGEPGATVTVTVEGQQYTTTVDEAGVWTVEVPTPTESGTHTVDVIVTDGVGNTETMSETFEVKEKDPGEPPVDATSIEEPSNTVSGGAGSCSVSGVPRGSGGSSILLLALLAGLAVRRKGAEK